MSNKKPTVEVMTVTPSVAENWLTRNADRNRRLRRAKVEQYAADIIAGKWRLSDQAISFDRRHRLVNGQHRLEAVLLADRPIISLVMHNLPDEAMLVLDSGMKRSTDDNLGMAGRDYVRGCGATVRRVLMGADSYAGRSFTDQEVDEFMADHGAAVAFAHRLLPNGKFGKATLRAALCRARLAGGDSARLEKFAQVLTTGMMVPGDEAAILLRTAVYDLGSHSSGTDRQRLYALAEAALQAFLAETPLRKLAPAKEELFPLPGEGRAECEGVLPLHETEAG